MNITNVKTEFHLNAPSIDRVSQKVQDFLETGGLERKNILRLRLSVEDMLLKYREHFGEDTVFTMTTGSRFGRPFISFKLVGESYDPFDDPEDDFGEYSSRMLSGMGLCPMYSYQHGANCIAIRLKKKHLNPLVGLFGAVLAAVLLGFIGLSLPDSFRLTCSDYLLTPIYKTFLGILSTIAGPMIFLSVAWGIYGIGDAALLGRIGKKMLLRFVGLTFLVTSLATAVLLPFAHLNYAGSSMDASGIKDIVELLLGIFPQNIVSPFLDGNSMQIILIAVVVGCIMLILGSQTKMVALFIEQINYIIQYLMELVSSIVPAFIFVILLRLLWSDSVSAILGAWKPLLWYIAMTVAVVTTTVCYVCLKERVSPIVFIQKALPSFLIAFTTASSSAAFGTNLSCCEKQLGIDTKVASFGVPLSIVLYAPVTAIYFVCCVLYFSSIYRVEVSAVWIITALIVITISVVALPPIPGGALACYAIVFTQLGIPAEALGIVMIIDAIADFISTGTDTIMIQCELILEADQAQMLNKDILRRP